MISPRLSILMVAMSVVGTVAPMAAMADDEENSATNIISVPTSQDLVGITGLNDQENNAVQIQDAETEVEVEGDCEAEGDVNECGSISRGADAGNVDQSQELDQSNELETGDVDQEADQDNEVDIDAILASLAGEFEVEI